MIDLFLLIGGIYLVFHGHIGIGILPIVWRFFRSQE